MEKSETDTNKLKKDKYQSNQTTGTQNDTGQFQFLMRFLRRISGFLHTG